MVGFKSARSLNLKRNRKKRSVLCVDLWLKWAELGGDQRYRIVEEFRTMSKEDLAKNGYVPWVGWKDNMAWLGVPVYGKIHGGRVAPYAGGQTATTLNDRMKSNATRDLIKGMSRGQLPSMDMQTIALIGIVAVGAIIGLWWMGVF